VITQFQYIIIIIIIIIQDLCRNLEGKKVENRGLGRRVILPRTLQESGRRTWSGLIWLSLWTSERLLFMLFQEGGEFLD
jgi:hypothetical protein